MPGRVPFAMYPGKNFFRTLNRVEKTKSCETSCRKTYNDENEDVWKILGSITKSAYVTASKSR